MVVGGRQRVFNGGSLHCAAHAILLGHGDIDIHIARLHISPLRLSAGGGRLRHSDIGRSVARMYLSAVCREIVHESLGVFHAHRSVGKLGNERRLRLLAVVHVECSASSKIRLP